MLGFKRILKKLSENLGEPNQIKLNELLVYQLARRSLNQRIGIESINRLIMSKLVRILIDLVKHWVSYLTVDKLLTSMLPSNPSILTTGFFVLFYYKC